MCAVPSCFWRKIALLTGPITEYCLEVQLLLRPVAKGNMFKHVLTDKVSLDFSRLREKKVGALCLPPAYTLPYDNQTMVQVAREQRFVFLKAGFVQRAFYQLCESYGIRKKLFRLQTFLEGSYFGVNEEQLKRFVKQDLPLGLARTTAKSIRHCIKWRNAFARIVLQHRHEQPLFEQYEEAPAPHRIWLSGQDVVLLHESLLPALEEWDKK